MGRLRKMTREEMSEQRRSISSRAEVADLPFPKCIREMRTAIGLSQADFAKMTGLTIRMVAEIEKGRANPTLETILRLASPFGLQVGLIPRHRKA